MNAGYLDPSVWKVSIAGGSRFGSDPVQVGEAEIS